MLPALLLNYFGQGALLLRDASAVDSPFYHLASESMRLPLILLATLATVIASQAVISGAFSLAYQAVRLGLMPRMEIVHTSKDERGQVYVPLVNWMLLVMVILLVVTFQSSSQLANAYGIAVSTTMIITAVLLFDVARDQWKWSRLSAGSMVGMFLVVDVSFFAANLTKVTSGGWMPLLAGVVVGMVMATWKRGRELLERRLQPLIADANLLFATEIETDPPRRVASPAVYLTTNEHGLPLTLVLNVRHHHVMHRPIGLLTIVTEDRPYVTLDDRVKVTSVGRDIYRITAHYGFKQIPNVPNILEQCRANDVDFTGPTTTFFLGHVSLDVTSNRNMSLWRKRLFVWMSRNSRNASRYYEIPSNQVVEIGARLEI